MGQVVEREKDGEWGVVDAQSRRIRPLVAYDDGVVSGPVADVVCEWFKNVSKSKAGLSSCLTHSTGSQPHLLPRG